MKKKEHKYKVGDVAKFKFYDSGIYVGKIIDLCYMGELVGDPNYKLPEYKIEAKPAWSERMMYYTVSDTRILEVNGDLVEQVYTPAKPTKTKVKAKRVRKRKAKNTELDDAIQKQKDFMNHNTKV